ncbi:MAG: HAMP domain-containing histidine kinase [Patescibacteria group bacterium]|nr:HAMP domain-containing histidine kinase [Patescibacteria group bacterium]
MFHSARIKLTLWYVLIIMLVSLLFSLVIYEGIDNEFHRFERYQSLRIQREQQGLFPPPTLRSIDVEMIEDSRRRLTLVLLLINLGILVLAGGASYFLAGKTLMPIQLMVDEQNRFITDASHEFRTPLTSLRSEIEVNLRDKKLNLSAAKTLLKSNLEEVVSLQSLSEGLLELAQFPDKNNNTRFEKVSILEISQEAVKRIQPQGSQKQIKIENQVKNYPVLGHKSSLVELLVILLDNGIKYSPAKTNILLGSSKADSLVSISVSDQGTGIDEKDIPHLFDRFYRADISRSKEKVDGYGLGLAIAKKIADSHRGQIEVESHLKKGTKFTIKLPEKD